MIHRNIPINFYLPWKVFDPTQKNLLKWITCALMLWCFVATGGPADLAGLRVGDKVLSVNGVSVVHVDHYDAVEVLKACGRTLVLVILREVGKNLSNTVIIWLIMSPDFRFIFSHEYLLKTFNLLVFFVDFIKFSKIEEQVKSFCKIEAYFW